MLYKKYLSYENFLSFYKLLRNIWKFIIYKKILVVFKIFYQKIILLLCINIFLLIKLTKILKIFSYFKNYIKTLNKIYILIFIFII